MDLDMSGLSCLRLCKLGPPPGSLASVSPPAASQEVVLDEQTQYPFSEDIKVKVSGLKKKTASFPLYLRIPTWTEGAHVTVNGKTINRQFVNLILSAIQN